MRSLGKNKKHSKNDFDEEYEIKINNFEFNIKVDGNYILKKETYVDAGDNKLYFDIL